MSISNAETSLRALCTNLDCRIAIQIYCHCKLIFKLKAQHVSPKTVCDNYINTKKLSHFPDLFIQLIFKIVGDTGGDSAHW